MASKDNIIDESIKQLLKVIDDDYTTLMTKELDTDEELSKQANFLKNLQALHDFLEKKSDKSNISKFQQEISSLMKEIKDWDVYGYWFKEMDDLTKNMKNFIQNFSNFIEPAEKKTPDKKKKPKPTPITPPSISKSSAGERSVPKLKPVFKIPPIKPPRRTSSSAKKENLKPGIKTISTPDSKPMSLKKLVEEKKMEIHLNPAKIMKPGHRTGIPDAQDKIEEPPPPNSKVALKPVLPSRIPPKDMENQIKKNLPPPNKPVAPKVAPLRQKGPMRMPKPIKIDVPELTKINLSEEVETKKPDDTISVKPDQHEKTVTRAEPVSIKLNLNQPDSQPLENDKILDEITKDVSTKIDKSKLSPISSLATAEKKEKAENWEKPVQFKAEEVPIIIGGDSSENMDQIAGMIGEDGEWDEEKISSILDDVSSHDTSSSEPVVKLAKPVRSETPAISEEIEQKQATITPTNETSPFLTSQEQQIPQESSIINNEAESSTRTAENEPMNLFMGALQSKKQQADEGHKTSVFSFFQPGAKSNGSMSSTGTSSSMGTVGTSTKKPIGADVDISTLPDTRDGMYQTLIALEGKRYSLERAKKDLRSELESGKMEESDYQRQLVQFKKELDSIASKIKGIREKIKNMK